MTYELGNRFSGVTRRGFVGGAAGTAALLALSPDLLGERRKPRYQERRTWFVNLSHEPYAGHEYFIVMGGQRHHLRELAPGDPALQRAQRGNRFLEQVPEAKITHVVEMVRVAAAEVVLSYVIRDASFSTGRWEMSAIFLKPPLNAFRYAYTQARSGLELGASLPLSAKRRKYGLAPAVSLEDLLEEEALLDTMDWATAMVNLHPELLSVDPNSAAHIRRTISDGCRLRLCFRRSCPRLGPPCPSKAALPIMQPAGPRWCRIRMKAAHRS